VSVAVIKLAVVYPELGTATFVYALPVYDSTESALTGAAKHIASTPQVTNIVFFIGPPSFYTKQSISQESNITLLI
jgi:hypothetical protein